MEKPDTQPDLTARIDATLAATGGHTPGQWQFWTSCSWRRFRTADHAIIAEPYVAQDGHPDLQIKPTDAALIASAPTLRALLVESAARIRDLEAQIAAQAEAQQLLRAYLNAYHAWGKVTREGASDLQQSEAAYAMNQALSALHRMDPALLGAQS